jgi:DNA-binding NarL/FixJ family response regulator
MKILLADDHALFRDGMRYVLQKLDPNVEIVDVASFPAALSSASEHTDFDLVLLDLNMPGSDGAVSVKIFHLNFPAFPIVVISGTDQRQDIEKVLGSGAMGFISKMSSGKEMVHALKIVLDGGIYLPPQLLIYALNDVKEDKRTWRTNEFGLTPRQMEILKQLALGHTNKDISAAVGLAEGTVKIHVAAIFQSLHVNKRIDAVQTALRLGLLDADNIPAA